jgi:hypothetical protein
MHHTSLYTRLIFANKEKRDRIKVAVHVLHIRLVPNSIEGTNLLKFIYDQLYNGKPVYRHVHAPTDECPLYYSPDPCTHIAGECPDHEAHRINRHHAACQLVHAAIHKTAKGGGALYIALDLILVAVDTGIQSQTLDATLASLSSVS